MFSDSFTLTRLSTFSSEQTLLRALLVQSLKGAHLTHADISQILALLPASEGLAVTTRNGYIGLLAGPLIVGPVAEFVGLRLSLLILGIELSFTCAGWLVLSRRTGGQPWNIRAA